MILKVGHVFQATPVITTIINQDRRLPQKGSYRLARLYAKLKPEYDLILARRNSMIEAYAHKEMLTAKDMATGEDVQTEAQNFSVPLDKMPEFNAAWAEVANEEIEVTVEPIPLDQLDNGGGVGVISAGELFILDDLIRE